jgi:hypothetical protein
MQSFRHARSVPICLAILVAATSVLFVSGPAVAADEVFSDSWGLANGAAWSSGLWSVSTSGSGLVDVQGGEGRIRVSNAGLGRAVASMPAVGDSEILVSFRFADTSSSARL